MSGRVSDQLRAELSRLERPLANAGFLVGDVRVIDKGTWGRLDAILEGTQVSGKIQIHLGKKGRMSIVPQGNAAVAIAAALDGASGGVTTPNQSRSVKSPAHSDSSNHAPTVGAEPDRTPSAKSTVRGHAGELVVDCSKFGESLIGPTEWRGVEYTSTGTWREVFRSALHDRGHNNLGEFMAIVDACRHIERGELTCATLWSDSKTALSWFRTGKIRTTIDIDRVCDATFARAVREARSWLETADRPKWCAMMSRWDVSARGENPADFGRK